MALTAVIVDDEELARRELRYLIERVGGIDVIAEASNGVQAVQTIRTRQTRCLSTCKCQGWTALPC